MLEKQEVLDRKQAVTKKDCYVYFLIKNDEIIYIGQTTRGTARVYSHYEDKDFDSYSLVPCEESELNDLAAKYIVKFNPRYNITPPQNNLFASKNTLKKKLKIEGFAFNAVIRIYGIQIHPKNQLEIAKTIEAFEQAKKDGLISYNPGSFGSNDWFLAKGARGR